ncbi:MAG: alpha/beta fold hydrolase [Geodermatophilaceae bacterium]|nr:alpha/beta fold hydrolase [Geodermatophilaceae bacterium]
MGIFWLVIASAASASVARADDAPRSSRAPRPDYPHKSFSRREHGDGGRSYWLFEPAEPTPRRAPVVVFHHGWLAWNPGVYGAWIDHLVRSGRVVIFPRYQVDWATRPADFLPNTVAAVRDAFDVLETAPGHVRPDRDRFALVGHSAGGGFALRFAGGAHGALFDRYVSVAPFLHHAGDMVRKEAVEWAVAAVPRFTALCYLNALGVRLLQRLPVLLCAVPPERDCTASYSFRLALNFRPNLDWQRDVRSIRAKTTVLIGEADELFHAPAYGQLFEGLNERVSVQVLKAVDHTSICMKASAVIAIRKALV